MAILPILLYPDPQLKEISEPVVYPDEELEKLIADLLETMYSSPGCVGIAAPQVGVRKRVLIIDSSRNPRVNSDHGRVILVNPSIDSEEGEVMAREGCLSIPDLTANVKRAQKIAVGFNDEHGARRTIDVLDFEARVILHEYDHLDGILFLDRVSSLKTDVFRRKRQFPHTDTLKIQEAKESPLEAKPGQ